MKTIRLFVVLLAVAVMTGCATAGGYRDTTTGAVVGGLLGGAIGGSKGAVKGGLFGAGIGALVDSQNRKNDERAEKIGSLIDNKTGGGNDSGAAQSAAAAERNLAFAEQQRRKCEAKYGTYQKNGVRIPHNCQIEFNRALADADYLSETDSPEVFHATMRGGYGYGTDYRGQERAIRRAERQAYWGYWGTVGPYYYNQQYGYNYGRSYRRH